MKTAVEWLIENSHIIPKNELYKKELVKQAKQLENQQRIEMFDKGFDSVEQLNDEYVIEFVGWMYINCSFNNYPLYKMYEEGEEQFTSKEVLEIFKKQKEL